MIDKHDKDLYHTVKLMGYFNPHLNYKSINADFFSCYMMITSSNERHWDGTFAYVAKYR